MSQDPRDLKDPTTHAKFAAAGLAVTILLVIAQLYPLAGFTFVLTLVWARRDVQASTGRERALRPGREERELSARDAHSVDDSARPASPGRTADC